MAYNRVLMKRAVLTLVAMAVLAGPVRADETGCYRYAESLFKAGDYYNAITELKRYLVLYPKGGFFGKSLVLMGQSYARGGNFVQAAAVLSACSRDLRGSDEGETAQFYLTGVYILQGMPSSSLHEIQVYRDVYPGGKMRQRIELNFCYALAFKSDLQGALDAIASFKKNFPDTAMAEEANRLQDLISHENDRGKKSMAVAVLGSLLVPGFGYFYTGNYGVGLMSFLTNSLLIYLVYNAVRIRNTFQIAFFSLLEFSFYQYSLYGAVRSVREYNGGEQFLRSVRISFEASF